MSHHQEAKLAQNISPPYPQSRHSKQGSMRASHCQEVQSEEKLPSALQAAVNATEPRHEHARSTDTMEDELKVQEDRPISPVRVVQRIPPPANKSTIPPNAPLRLCPKE
ncbi:hypothetical protein MY1884_008686 [Beauveria asiatica]